MPARRATRTEASFPPAAPSGGFLPPVVAVFRHHFAHSSSSSLSKLETSYRRGEKVSSSILDRLQKIASSGVDSVQPQRCARDREIHPVCAAACCLSVIA